MQPDPLRDDIARARRGERDALDRVLTTLQSRLRAAAAQKLGAPLRAKMATSDLLQSTYVDVVRSIRDFEGDDPDTLVAWILRIMENNVRDRLRFFGRQRRKAEVDPGEEPLDVPADTPTPSLEAMRVESVAAVGKALAELSEDDRRILQLRMFERRDYKELSGMLDKSEGALRMEYSRAKARLTFRLDRLLNDT